MPKMIWVPVFQITREPATALRLSQIVNFADGDAARIIFAANDCSIIPCGHDAENRGVTIVVRGQSGCRDLGFLGRSPIVVRNDERAILVAQLERWIGQSARDAALSLQVGPNRPEQNLLRLAAPGNQPVD